MDNNSYRITEPDHTSRTWYKIEVLRELSISVPLTTAKSRLLSAFASKIAFSKGFLLASYEYSGKLEGNNLDVDFTVSGRSRMNYHLSGQLTEDVNGTKLKLKISPGNSLLLILMSALFLLFFTQNIITIIVLVCIFILLNFAVMRWHCNVAADSATDLLNKIISGQPYN